MGEGECEENMSNTLPPPANKLESNTQPTFKVLDDELFHLDAISKNMGTSDLKYSMMAFPEAFTSITSNLQASTGSNEAASKPISSQEDPLNLGSRVRCTSIGNDFDSEYLKSTLTECIEETTEEFRKKLWTIEFDQIKNFEALKIKIENLDHKFEEMALEQRLREEQRREDSFSKNFMKYPTRFQQG